MAREGIDCLHVVSDPPIDYHRRGSVIAQAIWALGHGRSFVPSLV